MQSIISDGKQRLVPLVLSLACGLLFLPALSVSASAEALNKQAVKKKISGNTVKLFNKRQQAEVFLYFAPGGKVAGVINSKPARKIRQKWSIKKNGALCRFIAAQKKNICRRMEADGNKLRFVKGDGSLAFEATLLPGKQLPADGPQQAMGKGGGGKKPGMVIKKQDQNGDGRLSKQEFKGPPQKFAKIDADKDGFITTKELAAAQARRGGAGPKGGAMANGPDGNGNPPSISDRLAMMDSNGDGKVEPSEWRGKEQIFKRLDRNHDGYITSSEVAELEKKKSQNPLMTLAMQNLRAPERQLERRAHRQD